MRLCFSRPRGFAQLAGLVRPQMSVFCLKARIGDIKCAIAAMGAGGNQSAAGDADALVALFAAIVRGFARYFASFFAHDPFRFRAADAVPTRQKPLRSARRLVLRPFPV